MPALRLLATLSHFFRVTAPLVRADLLLVAFSGGPDSTALLWGLATLIARGELPGSLRAVHVDHALDPGSATRAGEAAALAGRLGVPFTLIRLGASRPRGESPEAAARRGRYAALAAVREGHGGRWLATAHHRDDQAETVLLRLLAGSGLSGLAAIAPRRGTLVRPLLGLPAASLARAVAAAGLAPAEDPTNRDLRVPRNRLRHLLLPRLAAAEPGLETRLARVAAAAAGARLRLEAILRARLAFAGDRIAGNGLEVAAGAALEAVAGADLEAAAGAALAGPSLALAPLAELPEPLWPHALALLHREAGRPYPPGRAAGRELRRQVRRGGRVGCAAGGGWRWRGEGGRLRLEAPGAGRRAPPFTYTLGIPGELEIPELALRVRVTRQRLDSWMLRGSPTRVGLALPLEPGDRVAIRNRRPGDRIQPFGSPYSRPLKDVLIDRRVPREARDRLPLLCVGERLAWVPGVTIDERFRIPVDGGSSGEVWVAEVEGR